MEGLMSRTLTIQTVFNVVGNSAGTTMAGTMTVEVHFFDDCRFWHRDNENNEDARNK